MAGKIVVNYNAVEQKTFQLITDIETELKVNALNGNLSKPEFEECYDHLQITH